MNIYLIEPSGVLNGPIQLPVIPGIGIQIPENSVVLNEALPAPSDGHLWAWANGETKQMPDQRGLVFRTDSGVKQEWNELGDLPEYLTAQPWPGMHYVWLQGSWKHDADAERESLITRALADRDGLLQQATIRIAPLQDAAELDEATKDEETALIKWKRYRVALNRIEQQGDFPLDIEWPTPPENMKYR